MASVHFHDHNDPHHDHASHEYLEEDIGHKLIKVGIIFIVLCSTFVPLRFYAKYINRAPLAMDDLLITFAWVTTVGVCVTAIVSVPLADVGRHLAYANQYHPEKVKTYPKIFFAMEILYLPSVTLPKISILCLYLRVFTSKPARIISYALVYFLLINWITYTIAATLQCIPLNYLWNPTTPGGRCIKQHLLWQTISAPNILTDVIMMILPMPTVFKLKMSWANRLGVLSIFIAGSSGLTASCIRVPILMHGSFFDSDGTYNSVALMRWTIIEPSFYLLAACFVSIRPVLLKLAEALHLKNPSSGGGSSLTYEERTRGGLSRSKNGVTSSSGRFARRSTHGGDESICSRGIIRTVEFEVQVSDAYSSPTEEDIPLKDFAEEPGVRDASARSEVQCAGGRNLTAIST